MWFQKRNPKKTEYELKLEELLQQYSAIFDNTEDAIFLIRVIDEKDFMFVRTNKSHQIKTGITPEMINDKTPEELLGKELGDIVTSNYRRCVKERKRIEYIETLDLPAGTRTWRTTLTPVFEDDKITFIVGIAYDITESENYVRELRRTNRKLNAILETSPDGIAIVDHLGNFKFASERIAEMLGFNKKDTSKLIGRNIREFIKPETYEKLKNNITYILQHGSFEKPNVYEFVRADGQIRYGETNSKLLIGDDNQIEGILVTARDITERIKIEKEKENISKTYQVLFESSPSGILLLDESGNIIDANSKFLSMVQYEKKDIIGKHCSILSKETNKNPISENIKRILNGENLVHEITNYRKDGTPVEVLLNERAIELPDGKKAILSISTDITELKEKEKRIQESELMFRTIADHSHDWIYLVGQDLTIKYMSPSVEKITGYTVDEFKNNMKLFIDIIHPDDKETFLTRHKIQNDQYNFESDPDSFEFRIITKDGNIKYLSHICFPIYDQEGKFFGRRVTNRDITEIISQKEKIDYQLNKLRQIIDGTKVGTWEWDLDSGIAEINKYFANMIGYELDELVPFDVAKFQELLHPDDFEQWEYGLQRHLEGRSHIFEATIRLKHKDGSWVWVQDMGKVLERGPSGEPKKIIGIHLDITPIKEYEEEVRNTLFDMQETRRDLEESLFERNLLIEELTQTKDSLEKANSEKDKFFSIIAHDLRSPLSAFMGLTKLIVEDFDMLEPDDIKDMVNEMQKSSSSVFKLLENLLEWSRLQRGVMKFEPEDLDLGYVIDQNLSLQEEAAKIKNIELINEVKNKCIVFADPTMLNTIFRNLVSNAIKFTPRNGKVWVGALPNPNIEKQVTIFVRDSGIGIPEHMIDKLFDITQKTSRPGTEGEASSGLGLLLCKEFVEKHNGKIWVESQEGKGTTFYFTLQANSCY